MFRVITLAIQYLPLVIGAIRFVEALSREGEWHSQDKRAAALKFIREVAGTFGHVISDEVEKVLGQIVDTVVGILNVFNGWGKSQEVMNEAIAPQAILSAQVPAYENRLVELEEILTK